MMKKMRLFLLLSIGILFAHPSVAAVFCVSSAPELQEKLTEAASNGQDDEVQIVQGTYIGNFVYYTSTEAYNLSLSGGYSNDCITQFLDPSNTIFDGDLKNTVLSLSAVNLEVEIIIKGITIQNGLRLSGNGGGLSTIVGDGGQVYLERNVIKDNAVPFLGGVCM